MGWLPTNVPGVFKDEYNRYVQQGQGENGDTMLTPAQAA